jgi:hypothetical protein
MLTSLGHGYPCQQAHAGVLYALHQRVEHSTSA